MISSSRLVFGAAAITAAALSFSPAFAQEKVLKVVPHADLKVLDEFPTPDDGPDFYVDFDETGPYEAIVGESECAT